MPLFTEELARLAAAGRDAADAPTIEAAMQVHLDQLDDFGRDAAAKLSVFGQVGWDAGLDAIGVANAAEVLRELAAAEILVEQARARFAGTREFAFKHALMREVAYASLGEDGLREYHARAGRWLATVGEDDAVVARHLELGGQGTAAAAYVEKAARRSLAAHALPEAVALAEKALAFAEDKPTQFARAQLLDEAWNRLDARAGERDTAVRAMEESIYDEASGVRARGARVRYEDASGGGPETSGRLEEVRRQAHDALLFDEEARCAAALAARYAYAGELDAAETVSGSLLTLSQRHGIAGAGVDAWQTLAVIHQARGEVGAALEARRSAAATAKAAALKTREATLTVNVGFALTTLGAKAEARAAIDTGISLAQAVGSPGVERHGKMILLCWAATFGESSSVDAQLTETRAMADAALAGSWVPHDRATLGVLFYRGVELLRAPSAATGARTLLRIAAQGYRATKMLDVLPVALGLWADAERRCGNPGEAHRLASEAAALFDHGSPSLLNEAAVFLALHDACAELGDAEGARGAIARGVPRLVTRLKALATTPYGLAFLTELAPERGLARRRRSLRPGARRGHPGARRWGKLARAMKTAKTFVLCVLLPLSACDEPKGSEPAAASAAAPAASPPPAPPAPPPPPDPVKTLKKKLASDCKPHPATVDFGDDAALEHEVRRKLLGKEGAITPADLATIKSINLVNTEVHQIDPCIFPMFTTLKDLFLGNGEYDDLTPIQKLTSLESLRLSFSVVKDIHILEGLKRLDRLDLSHTLVTDDDLKPLSALVNLTELQLDEDSISDLTPVANMKKLERLSIKKTDVKNLAPVASLKSLKFLYIADTPVTDISPVQSLVANGMKLITK